MTPLFPPPPSSHLSCAAPIQAPRRLPIRAFAFMMLGALPLAGCNDDDNGQAKAAAAAPAVEVGVVTLKPERVAISTELPGRTSAYRIADVRPQVSGDRKSTSLNSSH